MVLVAACSVASPSLAFAQSSRDRAAARSAADAGADAYEQGQYDRSLDLFTRAEQLMHAPPHLLYIGRSLAKLGRLVEAREAFLKIINEQLPASAPPAFKTAHAQADSELSTIENRIAYVTVMVQGPDAKQAVVTMDHTDLPPAEADIPIPTDPGNHVFSAHTTRAKSNDVSLSLRDGAKQTVNLVLPEPSADAPPVAGTPGGSNPGAGASAGPGTKTPDHVAPAPSSGTSGQAIAGYVALGVGAVGVGVGTYFLASSLNSRSEANKEFACDSTALGCSDAQQAQIQGHDDDADKSRTLAIVTYAVGGAAAVTGLVLLLTDKHAAPAQEESPSNEPFSNVRVLPGVGSITLSGQF